MRATLCAVLILSSSCGLVVNRAPPRYASNGALVAESCRQSNWPAGVDLLGVATGAVIVGVASEENDPSGVGIGIATAALTAASMIYSFMKSGGCRSAHRKAGYPTRGAYHWLIPPAIVLTAGAAAALAGSSGSSAPSRSTARDTCAPGEPITALCEDGTYSCSQHRRGTCSSHGGVSRWYRHVAP